MNAAQSAEKHEVSDNPSLARYLDGMRAWRAELEALRPILLAAGLREELKWRKPCYTHEGRNIVIFQPFKQMCALLFFKGALLDDPSGALREQGEHSRSSRRLEFRSVVDVNAARSTIATLIHEAIRVEQAGLSVPARDPADDGPHPRELVMALDADAALREAWQRLTPGRRRGWVLYFNAAKQSETRLARIERSVPQILEGFGRHDRA